MKLNIFILVLTVILGLIITMLVQVGAPSHRPPLTADATLPGTSSKQLPAFDMQDLAGKTYNSGDFAGKTVMINFWATWCPPCVAEFPRLLQIARAHPDKLVLLAISSDDDAGSIERFLSRLPPEDAATAKQDNVHIVHDQGNRITFDLFQTAMLPETIIVDPKQEMVEKLVGADWTIDDISPLLPPAPK